MPIYEYKCLDCGEEFTKIVFNVTGDVECVKCNSSNVEKMISLFSSGSSKSSSPRSCSANTGFS